MNEPCPKNLELIGKAKGYASKYLADYGTSSSITELATEDEVNKAFQNAFKDCALPPKSWLYPLIYNEIKYKTKEER